MNMISFIEQLASEKSMLPRDKQHMLEALAMYEDGMITAEDAFNTLLIIYLTYSDLLTSSKRKLDHEP